MKKLLFVLLGGTIFMTSCVDNPEGKKAETKDSVEATTPTGGATLNVDTAASSVAWLGNKITGKHNGTIRISSGALQLAEGKLTGGKFTIDMNTISNSDITDTAYKAKLEGHLKAADFFDVAKYPTANFEITSVKDSASKITIAGNLTLRGVTKNITFDANVLESSATAFKAKADFNINRSDWGVNYPGKKDDAISQEINLKVDLQAKP
ncbi:YceI family protein [Pseudoflavitalea sp. G-6-1-2]|uniref:YceI family protein n=1 Tax=Pseudoflavitalea sp. G-6-1-2 TaxID=2728841 RepID=UPI00146B98EA|nr:YceI family protein [Pseudoflavitalea sp. G-6-1-2]NML21726.1 YceI family protein [Pseudoflavitalea sp. G-6-1-2]